MSYRTKAEAAGQRSMMGDLLAVGSVSVSGRRCVSVTVAGGTYGSGPVVPYVGRNPMTEGELERFAVPADDSAVEPAPVVPDGPGQVTRVLDLGVLVQAVKAHAKAQYDSGKASAWDYVHVSMADSEIAEAIGEARTLPVALRVVCKAARAGRAVLS